MAWTTRVLAEYLGPSGDTGEGVLELVGEGVLTTELVLAGAGSLVLSGTGALTTQIPLVASGSLALTGGPSPIEFRGTARTLRDCGHPFMALANWKDPNSC